MRHSLAARVAARTVRALPLLAVALLGASGEIQATPILNPFGLQSGVGGDNYGVATYNSSPQTTAAFNSTTGALLTPGLGYGSLGGFTGNSQTDAGGVANPSGNLANGISTSATGTGLGNASFGSGSVSFGASNSGISWNSFGLSDPAVDQNFSESVSRGTATYAVNSASLTGQVGVALGIAGLLPTNAQGFAALDARFTDVRGGMTVFSGEVAVVVTASNTSGVVSAVSAGGSQNTVQTLSINLANGASNGAAGNGSLSQFNSSFDGSNDLVFTAGGLALLPSFTFQSGDVLTIDATLTLAADPMMDFLINPLPFPLPGDFLIGPTTAAPEPSTLAMSGTALAFGLAAWRHRRSRRRLGAGFQSNAV